MGEKRPESLEERLERVAQRLLGVIDEASEKITRGIDDAAERITVRLEEIVDQIAPARTEGSDAAGEAQPGNGTEENEPSASPPTPTNQSLDIEGEVAAAVKPDAATAMVAGERGAEGVARPDTDTDGPGAEANARASSDGAPAPQSEPTMEHDSGVCERGEDSARSSAGASRESASLGDDEPRSDAVSPAASSAIIDARIEINAGATRTTLIKRETVDSDESS